MMRPGMNHFSMMARSLPEWNKALSQFPKRRMSRMAMAVIETLIRKEAEAISDFSSLSSVLLTYRIWAFLSKLVLVISKMLVTTMKRLQVPAWVGVRVRISTMKLTRLKKVMEKRCRIV